MVPITLQIVPMDHLAALFGHFTPSARAFFSGNLCNRFSFENPDNQGYLHVLKAGRVRVLVPGHAPVELSEPSLVLLPRYLAHRFEPDPLLGADLVCATVEIGATQGNPIALGLPGLVILPLARIATVGPTVDLLFAEAFAAEDGRQVALDRLFEYLVVQLIRHVIASGQITGGVLATLRDPRLARAVTAMHEAPGRIWTLEDLADVAGMSRTGFARTFRHVAETTPMDYLTRWRMTLAQSLLREGKPIKAVASAVGYESPAALTRTFTKLVGLSPRHWTAARQVKGVQDQTAAPS